MIAKKIIQIAALVTLLAIVALPARSTMTVPATFPVSKTENPVARQLLQRLEEIKEMDKSELTGIEKRNLRKEVKGIKKEMKRSGGGIYVTAGAVIIIFLLFILTL